MVLRSAWIVLSLVLVLAASSNTSDAAIVLTNTTTGFGPSQTLLGFSSPTVSNFNVGGGVTVTAPSSSFLPAGLFTGTSTLTFNFATPVTGFGMQTGSGSFARTYTVAFGGTAETNSVGTVTHNTSSFAGFVSNTNTTFNSATVTFSGTPFTYQLTDFRTIAAVPEPTTMVTGGLAMLIAAGASLARRKKRASTDKTSSDLLNAPGDDKAV